MAHVFVAHATAEDPSRAISDVLILSACVASLAAVGVVLVRAHSATPPAQTLPAGLSLVGVAVSWLTLHSLHAALRPALLQPPGGGIDFNQQDPPDYRDFAYTALTLGMPSQVSDTSLQSSNIRTTALQHALLSYLSGAVILATAINLIASSWQQRFARLITRLRNPSRSQESPRSYSSARVRSSITFARCSASSM